MRSKIFNLSVPCLILAMLLGLLTACSASPERAAPSPIEITDQLGRTVKLDKFPERIISLSPSNTEILFALGLADRVVGVTDYCDYPPEAKEKPSIGGFSTPSIEQIVVKSPDLILAASIHEKKIIAQLEQKGLTVLTLAPKTLNEVLAAITMVGEVSQRKKEASELVTEMQSRIETITDKTSVLSPAQRPRVLYLVWHDPLMAAGSGTLQDELIRLAGGINIAQDISDYAAMSLESIIEANPEVMIAGGGHGSGQAMPLQYIKTEPRLRDTAARLNSRVHMVDANLVSRPGPRIATGLEEFARLVHPELFEQAK